MPRKVPLNNIKRLTVELPLKEYEALERYCLQRQETKRQAIRTLIRKLDKKVIDE
ncbi:CopG family transcriptional regulator [Aphanothece hegewaldii CCALA 016]|uniref:CopG family transcriptional regulator n=1 Tax=Aphanothece hegewaldii CCALA 016 TaxID=2107694 RepID=A0A2T1LU74_9CHRO|nr:CopG family transcriptional regulator [Aphanothece hegewaldii]PSF34944.1 CopG family transcriptional regulator [Aphanothece hegewaldii CCALA 016]